MLGLHLQIFSRLPAVREGSRQKTGAAGVRCLEHQLQHSSVWRLPFPLFGEGQDGAFTAGKVSLVTSPGTGGT